MVTVSEIVIVCLACYLIGIFAGHYFFAPKKGDFAGTLRLLKDETDGETYLFLDLDQTPESIMKKKMVQFRIDAESRK